MMKVQDLLVYQRLCDLHLEICNLTRSWPAEEKFELASQIRRSSNSSPTHLAEKHGNRHLRNKIEGVNGSRGEANETVHHLYIATRKGYVSQECFDDFRNRYEECVRMLNGLERSLERRLPAQERKWPKNAQNPQNPLT
jgi:four helix bundle protein